MKSRQIKILLISQAEINTQNSSGNTFFNLFDGMSNVEIANIYCRSGKPNVNLCSKYFQITEKQLVKNLICGSPVGKAFEMSRDQEAAIDTFTNNESHLFDFARKHRFTIFFWARELIWGFDRWKSYDLTSFVDEFNPDLVFVLIYDWIYMNRLVLFLKNYTNLPIVGYAVDDTYTLRQFSLSPLYWIDRFIKQIWVKRMINACEKIFVISDIQKQYFFEQYEKDCPVLYKGASFDQMHKVKHTDKSTIKLLYTGSLGTKRYESLSQIGHTLDNINKRGNKKVQLHIYSQTPITTKVRRIFNRSQSIKFHGSVSHEEVVKIQQEADVLVLVESLDLQARLAVKHSFSTKIVDYFNAGKCIFAIGWEKSASMEYLMKNDAAIVATTANEIKQKLQNLVNNQALIDEYAKKAKECGSRNHQITAIQQKLFDELMTVVNAS